MLGALKWHPLNAPQHLPHALLWHGQEPEKTHGDDAGKRKKHSSSKRQQRYILMLSNVFILMTKWNLKVTSRRHSNIYSMLWITHKWVNHLNVCLKQKQCWKGQWSLWEKCSASITENCDAKVGSFSTINSRSFKESMVSFFFSNLQTTPLKKKSDQLSSFLEVLKERNKIKIITRPSSAQTTAGEQCSQSKE